MPFKESDIKMYHNALPSEPVAGGGEEDRKEENTEREGQLEIPAEHDIVKDLFSKENKLTFDMFTKKFAETLNNDPEAKERAESLWNKLVREGLIKKIKVSGKEKKKGKFFTATDDLDMLGREKEIIKDESQKEAAAYFAKGLREADPPTPQQQVKEMEDREIHLQRALEYYPDLKDRFGQKRALEELKSLFKKANVSDEEFLDIYQQKSEEAEKKSDKLEKLESPTEEQWKKEMETKEAYLQTALDNYPALAERFGQEKALEEIKPWLEKADVSQDVFLYLSENHEPNRVLTSDDVRTWSEDKKKDFYKKVLFSIKGESKVTPELIMERFNMDKKLANTFFVSLIRRGVLVKDPLFKNSYRGKDYDSDRELESIMEENEISSDYHEEIENLFSQDYNYDNIEEKIEDKSQVVQETGPDKEKLAHDFAKNNPEETANIIQDWMAEDEEREKHLKDSKNKGLVDTGHEGLGFVPHLKSEKKIQEENERKEAAAEIFKIGDVVLAKNAAGNIEDGWQVVDVRTGSGGVPVCEVKRQEDADDAQAASLFYSVPELVLLNHDILSKENYPIQGGLNTQKKEKKNYSIDDQVNDIKDILRGYEDPAAAFISEFNDNDFEDISRDDMLTILRRDPEFRDVFKKIRPKDYGKSKKELIEEHEESVKDFASQNPQETAAIIKNWLAEDYTEEGQKLAKEWEVKDASLQKALEYYPELVKMLGPEKAMEDIWPILQDFSMSEDEFLEKLKENNINIEAEPAMSEASGREKKAGGIKGLVKGFTNKLANAGALIEEKKAKFFKNTFSFLSKRTDYKWTPTFSGFFDKWSKTYAEREERERNFRANEDKSKAQRFFGTVKILGNVGKAAGLAFFSTYRGLMMATMTATEAVGAAKEQRMDSEKMRLDEEAAEEEAWELYEKAGIGKKLETTAALDRNNEEDKKILEELKNIEADANAAIKALEANNNLADEQKKVERQKVLDNKKNKRSDLLMEKRPDYYAAFEIERENETSSMAEETAGVIEGKLQRAEMEADRKALNKSYRESLPEFLQKRLEHGNKQDVNDLTKAWHSMMQTSVMWRMRWVDGKIKSYENDDSLTSEEKDKKIERMLWWNDRFIKDMDKMIGGAGAIDTLAFGLKSVETAGKAASALFVTESLKRMGQFGMKIYENPQLIQQGWQALSGYAASWVEVETTSSTSPSVLEAQFDATAGDKTAETINILNELARLYAKKGSLGEASEALNTAVKNAGSNQELLSQITKTAEELKNQGVDFDTKAIDSEYELASGELEAGEGDFSKQPTQENDTISTYQQPESTFSKHEAPAAESLIEKTASNFTASQSEVEINEPEATEKNDEWMLYESAKEKFDFSQLTGEKGLSGAGKQIVEGYFSESLVGIDKNSPEYEALVTYNADRIKDLIVDDIENNGGKAFGLEGVKDPDNITAEQFNSIKWEKVVEEIDKKGGFYSELTPAQIESIVKNNESLNNYFKTHPNVKITSESVEAVLKGRAEEVLAPEVETKMDQSTRSIETDEPIEKPKAVTEIKPESVGLNEEEIENFKANELPETTKGSAHELPSGEHLAEVNYTNNEGEAVKDLVLFSDNESGQPESIYIFNDDVNNQEAIAATESYNSAVAEATKGTRVNGLNYMQKAGFEINIMAGAGSEEIEQLKQLAQNNISAEQAREVVELSEKAEVGLEVAAEHFSILDKSYFNSDMREKLLQIFNGAKAKDTLKLLDASLKNIISVEATEHGGIVFRYDDRASYLTIVDNRAVYTSDVAAKADFIDLTNKKPAELVEILKKPQEFFVGEEGNISNNSSKQDSSWINVGEISKDNASAIENQDNQSISQAEDNDQDSGWVNVGKL